jgi:hypothetical protein
MEVENPCGGNPKSLMADRVEMIRTLVFNEVNILRVFQCVPANTSQARWNLIGKSNIGGCPSAVIPQHPE